MESTNQNALPVGAILRGNDTYVIERVLGAGGFGITYLASTTIRHGNLSLKVQVAIKEHFMSDYCDRENGSTGITVLGKDTIHTMVANSRKDFLAEARRLHQLGAGHNNIVKVNEVFEANGTAYYVMEYLEGSRSMPTSRPTARSTQLQSALSSRRLSTLLHIYIATASHTSTSSRPILCLPPVPTARCVPSLSTLD